MARRGRVVSLLVLLGALVGGLLVPARAAPGEEAVPDAAPAARIAAWRQQGGIEATRGLADLVRTTEDDAVLRSALDALAAVGLREEGARTAVRGHLRHPVPALEPDLLRALGRVGDGRDLDLLTPALDAADHEVRAAAVRALSDLSGARLPPSAPRLRAWLRGRDADRAALESALESLASGAASPAACSLHEDSVLRFAWLDLPGVEAALRSWLQAVDQSCRSRAFRIAARLRLGNLADAVASTLPFTEAEGLAAAHEVAGVLGLEPELPQAPSR